MRFTYRDFLLPGKQILDTPPTYTLQRDKEDFKSAFGITSFTAEIAWNSIKVPKAKPKHFLWAMMFLKRYDDEKTLCRNLKTSRITLLFAAWKNTIRPNIYNS